MDSRAIAGILKRTVWILCASLFIFSAHAADVVFVLSKDARPYQQFVDSVRKSLDISSVGRSITSSVVLLDEYINNPNGHKLVVAVGTKATQNVIQANIKQPILSTLIPSAVYYELVNKASSAIKQRIAGVFIDHPFKRYIDFVNQINPEWKKLGLLSSQNNKQVNQVIEHFSKNKKIKIFHDKVKDSDEVIQTLNKVLDDSDVFLTLADPVVLNNSTAHGILLSAYHRKVPVVSYLKSYVKAGALAALYSTPEELGQQVGEIIVNVAKNKYHIKNQQQYPKYFSITVNQRVAHSLGLDNVDETKIKNVLYKMENIQ